MPKHSWDMKRIKVVPTRGEMPWKIMKNMGFLKSKKWEVLEDVPKKKNLDDFWITCSFSEVAKLGMTPKKI